MKFDAYEVAQEIIRGLGPLMATIRRHDSDMAKQIRRSANSVAANVTEGRGRKGKDRMHHFSIAYSEAMEISSHLDSGVSWGYLSESKLESLRELLDRERAMLWRLSRG